MACKHSLAAILKKLYPQVNKSLWEGCDEEAILIETEIEWGECWDGGEYSMIITTTQDLGAIALAAMAAQARVVQAMQAAPLR